MLVLGSAGHLGPLGALSGSVSRHCVHHAHCAVVVVGPEAGARPVARIVVSDSLDPRGATFAWAVEHAQRIGVGLHLLDAWHVDPLLPLDEQEVASIRRQTQADHERALTSLRALTSRGVRLTDEMRTGYARDVIQARTRPEDLLVVPHDRLRGISFTHARGPVAVLPPGVATSARGRVVTRTAAGSS